MANSADDKLIFSYFSHKRDSIHDANCLTVSFSEDNLHEMSKPIFRLKKIIKRHLRNFLPASHAKLLPISVILFRKSSINCLNPKREVSEISPEVFAKTISRKYDRDLSNGCSLNRGIEGFVWKKKSPSGIKEIIMENPSRTNGNFSVHTISKVTWILHPGSSKYFTVRLNKYSRASIARISLGPCTFVLDMGSSSH